MTRYFCCRHWVKWRGKIYKKGELLPEEFTHHDLARHIMSSRIGKCEVEESAPAEGSNEITPPAPPQPTPPAPVTPTAAPPKKSFNFKTAATGTPK